MKRVLILTKEYQHNSLSKCGGTGVFYKKYAEKLVSLGYEVFVFGTNRSAFQGVENGVNLYFIKDFFKKHKLFELLRSVFGKLGLYFFQEWVYTQEIRYIEKSLKGYIAKNNLRIDIIETHDWDGVSLSLEKQNLPYVVRTHGTWSVLEKYFGYKTTEGKKRLEKIAIAKAKNIINVSEYNREIYSETFGNDEQKIICNGINMSEFQPSEREKIDEYSIGYFGNISNEKGLDVVLRIFGKLLKKYPSATLKIIGKGKIRSFQQENQDVWDRVEVCGFLSGESLMQTLNKVHLFLFPSKGETFGLSLCEAMALEKVVVASSIPAFKEIIQTGKNGFIADNDEQYLEYIDAVFRDEHLRKEIEKTARISIAQRYNFDETVSKSIEYYKTIL